MTEPLKIAQPKDYLDYLILAGWGNVDQPKIPKHVMQVARELRMPELNPKMAGNPRYIAEKARKAAKLRGVPHCCGTQIRQCAECGADYVKKTPHQVALCGKPECRKARKQKQRKALFEARRRNQAAVWAERMSR